jgi:hypothetical protein
MVLELAAILEIGGNAGGTEGVITDWCGNSLQPAGRAAAVRNEPPQTTFTRRWT